jgi:hypothetical protein
MDQASASSAGGKGPADQRFRLIVNKQEKPWPERHITGAQIKSLAGSPPDWVVNQIVPGPGGDPEIGDTQSVDLDEQAEPRGIKKFITRKPTTTPGA